MLRSTVIWIDPATLVGMVRWTLRLSLSMLLCAARSLVGGSHDAPIASDAAKTSAAERLSLLRAVCGGNANENGCSTCPAGTDFPQAKLEARGVIYGHFLGRSSEDAAVGFFGCESHVSGLGGVFLLSRHSGAWKLVSLRPATIVDDCKKLPAPDGHDVLICFGGDGHQGVSEQYLYLLDFQHPWDPEAGINIFFMALDSVADCVSISRPQKGLVTGKIERVSFAPKGRSR